MANPSVCPSVCLSVRPSVRPSNAGIVCKRMDVSLNFFDILIGTSIWFFRTSPPSTKYQREPFKQGH